MVPAFSFTGTLFVSVADYQARAIGRNRPKWGSTRTERALAVRWFEAQVWLDGRRCPKYSATTREVPNAKPMPYWRTDCRSCVSFRTGTAITKSRLPLWMWVFAIYLKDMSTRPVDDLVRALSMSGVSKSQVSRLCGETDNTIHVFLDRALEGDRPYLWPGSGLCEDARGRAHRPGRGDHRGGRQ